MTRRGPAGMRRGGERGSGNVGALVLLLLASGVSVFVSMMFLTGVAQRGVIPRIQSAVRQSAPAIPPPAPDDAVPPVQWRPAAIDSVAGVGRQIEAESRALDERMRRLQENIESHLSRAGDGAEDGDGGGSGAKLEKLTKIYAGMKASQAALALASLTDREAEVILTRLPSRQASQILGAMDPARAARFTRRVLGLEAGAGGAANAKPAQGETQAAPWRGEERW